MYHHADERRTPQASRWPTSARPQAIRSCARPEQRGRIRK